MNHETISRAGEKASWEPKSRQSVDESTVQLRHAELLFSAIGRAWLIHAQNSYSSHKI